MKSEIDVFKKLLVAFTILSTTFQLVLPKTTFWFPLIFLVDVSQDHSFSQPGRGFELRPQLVHQAVTDQKTSL